jgi:hypothetical protein
MCAKGNNDNWSLLPFSQITYRTERWRAVVSPEFTRSAHAADRAGRRGSSTKFVARSHQDRMALVGAVTWVPPMALVGAMPQVNNCYNVRAGSACPNNSGLERVLGIHVGSLALSDLPYTSLIPVEDAEVPESQYGAISRRG